MEQIYNDIILRQTDVVFHDGLFYGDLDEEGITSTSALNMDNDVVIDVNKGITARNVTGELDISTASVTGNLSVAGNLRDSTSEV
jgi:hypothetical protein